MFHLRRFILCTLAVALCFDARAQEVSYRRITMKEKLKKFYCSGGRAYLGKYVHLLVPADRFRKEPQEVKGEEGERLLVFANQSVPLLVNPANLYHRRLMKKLDWQKKRIHTVSVFGKVVRPSFDVKGRCHIRVHKVKTYGGSLRKISGWPSPWRTRRSIGTDRESPRPRAGGEAAA